MRRMYFYSNGRHVLTSSFSFSRFDLTAVFTVSLKICPARRATGGCLKIRRDKCNIFPRRIKKKKKGDDGDSQTTARLSIRRGRIKTQSTRSNCILAGPKGNGARERETTRVPEKNVDSQMMPRRVDYRYLQSHRVDVRSTRLAPHRRERHRAPHHIGTSHSTNVRVHNRSNTPEHDSHACNLDDRQHYPTT